MATWGKDWVEQSPLGVSPFSATHLGSNSNLYYDIVLLMFKKAVICLNWGYSQCIIIQWL